MTEGIRRDRKQQHIDEYLKSSHTNSTLFDDIFIEHNALPELDFEEIVTEVYFLGKVVDYPLMINAITGGTSFSREINRSLSKIAKAFNIPMAVGSQTIALRDKESHESFRVVREIIGENGVILSNLSASATVEDVKVAMEIIDADGIQLHLNPAQELAMKEGDRHFKGILKNIENIVNKVHKPVIVKEVGFGMSRDVAKRLYDIGVRYIDISGKGGTNFIEIECRRNSEMDFTDIYSWGIPTALSLIECRKVSSNLNIIASGGIKNSLDVVKALIIGADMVAISGTILRILLEDGYDKAHKYMEDLVYKLRMLMLLTGSKDIQQLKKVPYRIKGQLKDLLQGLD
jgi:isopentenyl-diphosphate delta-isomerase